MELEGKEPKGKQIGNFADICNVCTGEEQISSLLFCQHLSIKKLSLK